jgi:hypothetical protein
MCGHSRNSGIGVLSHTEIYSSSRNSAIIGLGQTEILWKFQKFWNRCFESDRDFLDVPEILELLVWVTQIFIYVPEILERIIGLGQTEILSAFQMGHGVMGILLKK